MNEQNPKLEKIMNKVPGGLIISGIMWLIMCILIIAGMYLIKYPHLTYQLPTPKKQYYRGCTKPRLRPEKCQPNYQQL